MTRRQTASIPLAMGSRFYLPPPPVRVHSGLHSINQCSGCTSFQPNPLYQYTLLPEARVLTERIWMRGHALTAIANQNHTKWCMRPAPFVIIRPWRIRQPIAAESSIPPTSFTRRRFSFKLVPSNPTVLALKRQQQRTHPSLRGRKNSRSIGFFTKFGP